MRKDEKYFGTKNKIMKHQLPIPKYNKNSTYPYHFKYKHFYADAIKLSGDLSIIRFYVDKNIFLQRLNENKKNRQQKEQENKHSSIIVDEFYNFSRNTFSSYSMDEISEYDKTFKKNSPNKIFLLEIKNAFPTLAQDVIFEKILTKKRMKNILRCLEAYVDCIGYENVKGIQANNVQLPNSETIDAILKSSRNLEDKWCAFVSAGKYFHPYISGFKSFSELMDYYHPKIKNDNCSDTVMELFKNRAPLNELIEHVKDENKIFSMCASYLTPIFPFVEDDRYNYIQSEINNDKGNNEVFEMLYKLVSISNSNSDEFLASSIFVKKENYSHIVWKNVHQKIHSDGVFSYILANKNTNIEKFEKGLSTKDFITFFGTSGKIIEQLRTKNNRDVLEGTDNSYSNITVNDILRIHKQRIIDKKFTRDDYEKNHESYSYYDFEIKNIINQKEKEQLDFMQKNMNNLFYNTIFSSDYISYHFLKNNEWMDRLIGFANYFDSVVKNEDWKHLLNTVQAQFVKELNKKDSALSQSFEENIIDSNGIPLVFNIDFNDFLSDNKERIENIYARSIFDMGRIQFSPKGGSGKTVLPYYNGMSLVEDIQKISSSHNSNLYNHSSQTIVGTGRGTAFVDMNKKQR